MIMCHKWEHFNTQYAFLFTGDPNYDYSRLYCNTLSCIKVTIFEEFRLWVPISVKTKNSILIDSHFEKKTLMVP